jgi:hypothetical protein
LRSDYGPAREVEQRDRGLARLRTLTVAIAAGALGLVGFFSVLAASNFPGHNSGGTSSGSSPAGPAAQGSQPGDAQAPQQQPGESGGDQGTIQPQAPGAGFFGGGGRHRSAVSGGS